MEFAGLHDRRQVRSLVEEELEFFERVAVDDDQIGDAWERVQAWIKEHELESTAAPWEAYLTGPEDPGPPITEIFFPVR